LNNRRQTHCIHIHQWHPTPLTHFHTHKMPTCLSPTEACNGGGGGGGAAAGWAAGEWSYLDARSGRVRQLYMSNFPIEQAEDSLDQTHRKTMKRPYHSHHSHHRHHHPLASPASGGRRPPLRHPPLSRVSNVDASCCSVPRCIALEPFPARPIRRVIQAAPELVPSTPAVFHPLGCAPAIHPARPGDCLTIPVMRLSYPASRMFVCFCLCL
jgi:hypothetical protein